MLIDNFLDIQPGGRVGPHFPMVGLKKIDTTCRGFFSGLAAARIVSETSVGLAFFSLHLEGAVAGTTTLTQQMAPVGRAAEHREPWTVDHQLLCRELHLCVVFWSQCRLPAFIPLPLRVAAL